MGEGTEDGVEGGTS